MSDYKLAVIGVGNMAKAIIGGIQSSDVPVSKIFLYDKNSTQYKNLNTGRCPYVYPESMKQAVEASDFVLLAVKPQNYPEVLSEIASFEDHSSKLYITIAAGITAQSVSQSLGNAEVVRVLPNLPMTIGYGVSVICKNNAVSKDKFDFVCSMFNSAGSSILIDEDEMNSVIGVTSSSPAYVFKFIDCIYKGTLAQGLDSNDLLNAICDVFIGSAMLLKQSGESPELLISRVASKGGTTEQALNILENENIDTIIKNAMIACTKRAQELGKPE